MTEDSVQPGLVALGTATPESIPQNRVRTFMKRVAESSLEGEEKSKRISFLDRIYDTSPVERRNSVLSDYRKTDPDRFSFFPHQWSLEPLPGTEDRMERYRRAVTGLAESAAREAIENAPLKNKELTHIILTSCTGHFAPGPEIHLMKRLGLSPGIQRMALGFMGCYAGLSGLRTAEQILRARPDARVLQISVELCSLHFQKDFSRSGIIADSLFSDGCAAGIYQNIRRTSPEHALFKIRNTESLLVSGTGKKMTWEIGDNGFQMYLAPDIPDGLMQKTPSFLEHLTGEYDTNPSSPRYWAVHPGGEKILSCLEKTLDLPEDGLSASRNVLRRQGNMSSATVFFVLKRILSKADPGEDMIALGFGPGLTIEGSLLSVCPGSGFAE